MADTTNWLCVCGQVQTSRTSRQHECPAADVETSGADPDCYACGGTGTVAGFGRTGQRCPCIDAPEER